MLLTGVNPWKHSEPSNVMVSIHFILSILFFLNFWLYVSYFQWSNAHVKWLKLLVPEIPVSWLPTSACSDFWAHCVCVCHWGSHIHGKQTLPKREDRGRLPSCHSGLALCCCRLHQVCSVSSETAQVCDYALLEPRQLTQEFLALWRLSPKAANSTDSESC